MKRRGFDGKGQFSIVAALLVAVVLVTALMTTYSLLRNSPFETPPQALDAVNEINLALKNMLAYTMGYYCSILQVSGNRTYAQGLTSSYLSSGLVTIANEYPQWNPSFNYSSSNTRANWFNPTSYSSGNLSVTYSLPGLGISNIHYSTSSALNVTALLANPVANQTQIRVTKEGGSPVLALTPQNFNFHNYSYTNLAWNTSVHPSSANFYAFGNGTYLMNTPKGVSSNAYVIGVTDSRGIMVTMSRVSCYNYSFSWNPALYNSSLKNAVIVVEALQNGSLRWLGQNLQLTGQGRAIPPIPIKDFRINETINGVNRQVPFQVEDWASKYTVPLGISSSASIFGGTSGSQNMLVFLINDNVTSARIWWDGRDSANQTSYATTDQYFKQDNTQNGTLRNGILTLRISNFAVNSTVGTSSVYAQFMRVNDYKPTYGSGQAYVITNGIVRDIVQQEAEWTGGITNGPCYNLYSQIVITLPANATYYTYALRTIFVNSSQSRIISDLNPIQLSISCSNSTWGNGWGTTLAENGTSGGYPITQSVSAAKRLFINSTSFATGWAHHFAEFIKGGNGGGVMFTDASNLCLYAFDNATAKTGALNVTDTVTGNIENVVLEVDPVEKSSVSFKSPRDLTWYGAVVNFNGTEPIYPGSGSPNKLGLWVIVENPPAVRNAPIVTILPTSVTMDVGQSQTFTSTTSGGTTPYSYQWYLDSSPVSGATSAIWTYAPSTTGSHTVYVKVTDYAGIQATSNTATVTVNSALSATISPSSVAMDVGQSQTFTSTITGGTSPFAYQWYLDGSLVSGATSSAWTYTPSVAGAHTAYLQVTDNVGMQVTSNTATISVNGALAVTVSPSSTTMDVGQSQTLNSTVAGGTLPYAYQWYLNGTVITGATASTYTFTPSSRGHCNIYVKVTDNVGITATSNTATITVNTAPYVSLSPASVTMDVGQSQTFGSTITGGTSPYAYQWYLDGSPVSGATSATWTYTPSAAGSHTVYVKVTDNVGMQATSNIGAVTVNSALSVTISPTSVTIDVGQSQTFTSTVTGGTTPYTYQWYLNGNPVSGATSSTWTYTPSSAGSYTVYLRVTDSATPTPYIQQSNTAAVTVNAAPSVSISPTVVTMDVGQSQTFTSTVSGGTSPYAYQWYLNGTVITGATASTYTFTPSSRGHYNFYVRVTDNVGMQATSSTATATVNNALSVSISPPSVTMDVGQSQTFTSTVTGGTTPYTYQWYLNSNPVSGATNPTWAFAPSSAGSYTVYVKVTDNVGIQATSNTGAVTVNSALSVTISPSSVTLDVGQSQTFTATVTGGTTPYSYQWYLNGAAVSGATSSTWSYTFNSAGSYTVYLRVTDSATPTANTQQSNTATVTVNTVPSVTISPSSVTIDVGQSQTFTSSVSGGTSPYTYQWYLNSAAQGTGSTWTFTPSSAGSYTVYCNVTDNVGKRVKSNVVTVTVNNALSVTVSPSSVTLDVGQSKTFTSSVSGGTTPYSYQWYLNGAAVSGATSSTWSYTFNSAGSYTVYLRVTDSATPTANTQQSNTATVTVNTVPSVTISPASVTMDVSQSQTFTSTITGGTSPYTYQWYLNGTAITGATSSTYTFTPSSRGHYNFYVIVTDNVGVQATSNTATVTVNVAPSVNISPSSVTMDLGQSLTFTSSVSGGTSPYTYQWYLNGTAISGATGSTYTFTPSSRGHYNFYVKVTDNVGVQATSNTATATVNNALSDSILPTSATIDVGQSQTFTSTVLGGTSPYTYQWYLNGTAISGATASTYTFTPTSRGHYNIWVNVTDSTTTPVPAKSNIAVVTVNNVPSVSISPASVIMDLGQSRTFTSTVTGGTSPFTYQWYLNGTAISGATASTYTFTPTSRGHYNIYVRVIDNVGIAATSNTATITVNNAFSVSILPTSATKYVGQSQTFTSTVLGGTSPYTYQWYLNGTAISGATASTYTFTPTSRGHYNIWVNVTDSTTTPVPAKSNIAVVTVVRAPFGIDSNTSGTGTNAITLTLTTSYPNDILFLSVAEHSSETVSSVTSTGLSWAHRGTATYSSQVRVETWYAVCPSAQTTTITIALSSSSYGNTAVAFGISGANTTNPFDVNYVTNTGSGASPSASITTTNNNDFIIGAIAAGNNQGSLPTVSAGGNFNLIATQAYNTLRETSAEYRIVSATNTYTAGFTLSSSGYYWAMIVDAIVQIS